MSAQVEYNQEHRPSENISSSKIKTISNGEYAVSCSPYKAVKCLDLVSEKLSVRYDFMELKEIQSVILVVSFWGHHEEETLFSQFGPHNRKLMSN